MNLDQITGVARAVVPVILTLLVSWGLVPSEIANQITDAVIVAVVSVGMAASAVAAIWSIINNRTASKAQAVANEAPQVKIIVPNNASVGLLELAENPDVKNVVKAS